LISFIYALLLIFHDSCRDADFNPREIATETRDRIPDYELDIENPETFLSLCKINAD
jgi:hypothetical protein